MSLHNAVIIGSILILSWVIHSYYTAFRRGLREIPGPWLAKFSSLWRFSLVGRGKAHEEYRKLHRKYGQVVRTAPNVVDISDPAAISIIYGINSTFMKSDFYHTLDITIDDKSMPNMFSATSSEDHKALKRPVAQKFSMTSIRTLEYLVDPCTEIFIDAMREMQGQVVDLGVWVQWYAFDAIGSMTFAQQFGFMEHREDVQDVISGIEAGLKYAGLIGQVPWLHRVLLGSFTFRQLVRKLSLPDPIAIVTDMVEKAIKKYDDGDNAVDRVDFLAFLRQQSKSTGEQMSRGELMNHLMDNLLAGSDTTAISLRATFYYVIRDERIYRKLQEEIDAFQAAGKLSPIITYGESLRMEYLQLCLKEAMRMHPGVSYPLERVVPAGGSRLGGQFLPEGTIVGANAAVLHRNRHIFGEDADEFRPERWLGDEEKVKIMDRHLLTFGAGARTCIGKNISIMEMCKLVPQVLRQFELEWASDESEWDVQTYWFAKQMGLLVRFKERTQAQ
ncbi:P450 monooxygenase [Colletotrichum tofieldiae]|nr:P450 monooxygenase [Colletotrichum tofieldiae]